MSMRIVVLVLAVGHVLLSYGCSENEPSAPGLMRGEVAGVSFDCPAGWSIRAETDNDAVTLVTDKTVGTLGPSVLIQVVTDPKDRTVQETIDDLARAGADERKFKLARKALLTHERGFEYGLIEYSSTQPGPAVTQRFVVVSLGDRKRLIVAALALRGAWGRYEPVFSEVVASLALPPAGR